MQQHQTQTADFTTPSACSLAAGCPLPHENKGSPEPVLAGNQFLVADPGPTITFALAVSAKRGERPRPEWGPAECRFRHRRGSLCFRPASGVRNRKCSASTGQLFPHEAATPARGGLGRPGAPRPQNAALASRTAQPHGRPAGPAGAKAERAPGSAPFVPGVDCHSQVIKHGKQGLVIKMLTSAAAAVFLQFLFIHNV